MTFLECGYNFALLNNRGNPQKTNIMKITEVTFEPFMLKEGIDTEIVEALSNYDQLFKVILDKTETCFIRKENREITCLTLRSYPICTFFVDERFEENELIRVRTQL